MCHAASKLGRPATSDRFHCVAERPSLSRVVAGPLEMLEQASSELKRSAERSVKQPDRSKTSVDHSSRRTADRFLPALRLLLAMLRREPGRIRFVPGRVPYASNAGVSGWSML